MSQCNWFDVKYFYCYLTTLIVKNCLNLCRFNEKQTRILFLDIVAVSLTRLTILDVELFIIQRMNILCKIV